MLNRGFEWIISNEIYFKGYIQHQNERVLRKDDVIPFFKAVQTFDEFVDIIGKSGGQFAVIIKREDRIWAAVDKERLFPIYYSADLSIVSDDAESIRRKLSIPTDRINIMRCLQLYSSSFIPYEDTIYDEIKQLDFRQAVEIMDGKLTRKQYYYKNRSIVRNISRKDALNELNKVTNRAFDRVLEAVGSRPIALSLSSGYDSRYIACMLKEKGVENVICFSYGKKGGFEIKQARNVAAKLGYEWHEIVYSDEEISQIISSRESEFIEYATEHDYNIYLQNYIAAKKLAQENIIPQDSVIFIGLINDVTVGHYTPTKSHAARYTYDLEGLAKFVIDDWFAKFEITDETKKFYLRELKQHFVENEIEVNDYQSFVTAWDDCNLGYGHSRNYPKQMLNFAFYGYETYIPLMDWELVEFWRGIPVEMRVNYNLFEEYIIDVIGKKYGVGTKKTLVATGKTRFTDKAKRMLGGIVVRLAFSMGIPVRRRTDENNFAPLEVILFKKIRQRKAIKMERAGIRLLMDIYFMEQKYGIHWFEKIKKFIIK